jgi:Kyanoviridae DNA polymerase
VVGELMHDFYLNAFQHNGKIYSRSIERGKRVAHKIAYSPYLFEPSQNPNTEYRTIHGDPVEKRHFDSIWDARKYIQRYKDVDGFEIYGMDNFVYTYLNDTYPGSVSFDTSQVHVGNIDVEVGSDEGFPDIRRADKVVTAITLKFRDSYYSMGCGDFVSSQPGVHYRHCSSEKELLTTFLSVWTAADLDVVTGWNIDFFDIPYLINRIRRVLGEEYANRMSPWGLLFERTVEIHGQEMQVFTPAGIAVLDYMRLYKKFRLTPQESYSLNHISFAELGEKKLDLAEHENLYSMYKNNFQRFMEYNIRDVALVDRLDIKLGLINLALTLAYDAKINIEDVFGPVKMWDVIIHNYLLDKKMVIPAQSKNEKYGEFLGAYVKEPLVGMHEFPVSYDFASLYPSLIVQYNLSPETFIGIHRELFEVEDILNGSLSSVELDDDVVIAANSSLWMKDKQGFFPEIIETKLKERKFFKNKMMDAKIRNEKNPSKDIEAEIATYHNMQNAKKVQLNSLYGAAGNKHFRWYKLEMAEAITKTGQVAVKWVEKHINEFLNTSLETTGKDYVIAIDTDSNYIALGDMIKKFSRKTDLEGQLQDCIHVADELIQNKIDTILANFFSYTRGYKPFLSMKREAVANKGIWTAKKKYVLNVYNDEGVQLTKPKLKIVGIEAVKSSTPQVCREKIKEAIRMIMESTNDSLIDFIEKFRIEFYKFEFENIAIPVGVHNIRKYTSKDGWYEKGCPINVRGAILFNRHLKNFGVENKYQRIQDGDKTKYCYIKKPNPLGENVISCLVILPKEFGVHEYIDYDLQFEKTFLSPIKSILAAIGWKSEIVSSLEQFM